MPAGTLGKTMKRLLCVFKEDFVVDTASIVVVVVAAAVAVLLVVC